VSILELGIWFRWSVTTALIIASLAMPCVAAGAEKGAALVDAVRLGRMKEVQRLLDNGADVNGVSSGRTPLIEAAWRGNGEIAQLLLRRGANIHAKDNSGQTVMDNAVVAGSEKMIRLLMNHGAELTFEGAAIIGDVDTVRRSVTGVAGLENRLRSMVSSKHRVGVNAFGIGGCPILLRAAGRGHTEVVKALLDNGADPNLRSYWTGCGTALSAAAGNGHAKIVEMLLDKRADVNYAEPFSRGPLYAAVYSNSVETVKILLERGAQVKAGSRTAPKQGAADVMPGQNPPARSRRGPSSETVLQIAGWRGNPEMIILLKDHGAEITSLTIAAILGDMVEVERLVTQGADVNETGEGNDTPLTGAARRGHTEVARFLLEKGAGVNKGRGHDGWTALRGAAQRGHKDIVQLLVDSGANVDERDEKLWTALMGASWDGRLEIAELLLDRGADVNARNKGDGSPLMMAVTNGHTDVVQLLLEKGADPNARIKEGLTVLELAEDTSGDKTNTEVIALLKAYGAKD
jgi:ankyrin repeat protein